MDQLQIHLQTFTCTSTTASTATQRGTATAPARQLPPLLPPRAAAARLLLLLCLAWHRGCASPPPLYGQHSHVAVEDSTPGRTGQTICMM